MIAAEWRADPSWRRIDLLSDVHLHATAPKTFEAWRSHMLDCPADAVLILGDLFEVWVGDDARFGTFEQACIQVLRQASTRKSVAFMHGNRDFLLGADMCRDAGMQGLSDPTVAVAWDRRVLLTHGDALCISDAAYQGFRRTVRASKWQATFLQQPLADRRAQALAMRQASVQHHTEHPAEASADADEALCLEWLSTARADQLVHGHTHRPDHHVLPGGLTRYVLGDWDFEDQLPRARILIWTAAGLQATDLGAA